MKTLLLALEVVAFVYSGYTLNCRKCNKQVCDLNGNCAEGENLCFILQNENDTMGLEAIQGCAKTCPIPEPDQEMNCCNTDYCNSYR